MAPESATSADEQGPFSRSCAADPKQQSTAQQAPGQAQRQVTSANAGEPPADTSATAAAPLASIASLLQPVVRGTLAPRASAPTLQPIQEALPSAEGSRAAVPEQQHAQSTKSAIRADLDVGTRTSPVKKATDPAPAIKLEPAATSCPCLIDVHVHAETGHVQGNIPCLPQKRADAANKLPSRAGSQQSRGACKGEHTAVDQQSIQDDKRSGKRPSGLPSKDLPPGWQAHSTESESSRSHSASHDASVTQEPAVESEDMQVSIGWSFTAARDQAWAALALLGHWCERVISLGPSLSFLMVWRTKLQPRLRQGARSASVASLLTVWKDCAGGELCCACPETCCNCPTPTCPAAVQCARPRADEGSNYQHRV